MPQMTKPGRITSYTLMGLLLALMGALIGEEMLAAPLIFTWLVAINLITLLFYGIDKMNGEWADGIPEREEQNVRIPEVALLMLALAGGSPFAFLAVLLFTHKVSSLWFIVRLIIIFALQGMLLIFLWDQIPWADLVPSR